MPLINCEVSLILAWSRDCVTTNSTGKFVITVTLSMQDNAKLLQQLK